MMQLVHAFENHEHTICTSKEVTHIHAKEIDCDVFHRAYQNLSLNTPSGLEVIPAHFYADIFLELPQLKEKIYYSKKKSRGPPYFIV